MSPKRRSTVLALIVPALVVGTGYIYLVRPKTEKEVAQAREAVTKARQEAPSVAHESRELGREESLREEVRTLELTVGSANVGIRPAVVGAGERLAALLARNRLLLLEETLDPPSVGLLPPGYDNVSAGRVRSLKLAGRYLDMLNALRGLVDPSMGGIPLKLTLAREGEEFRWTLLLWM